MQTVPLRPVRPRCSPRPPPSDAHCRNAGSATRGRRSASRAATTLSPSTAALRARPARWAPPPSQAPPCAATARPASSAQRPPAPAARRARPAHSQATPRAPATRAPAAPSRRTTAARTARRAGSNAARASACESAPPAQVPQRQRPQSLSGLPARHRVGCERQYGLRAVPAGPVRRARVVGVLRLPARLLPLRLQRRGLPRVPRGCRLAAGGARMHPVRHRAVSAAARPVHAMPSRAVRPQPHG